MVEQVRPMFVAAAQRVDDAATFAHPAGIEALGLRFIVAER